MHGSTVGTIIPSAIVCGLALMLGAAEPLRLGTVFRVGNPNGSAAEFGLANEGWQAYSARYPQPVVFTAGESPLNAWPYIHPGPHDAWAQKKIHSFTIRFKLDAQPKQPLHLIIGQINAWENPEMVVRVNGREIGRSRMPAGSGLSSPDPDGDQTRPASMQFAIAANVLSSGWNDVVLALEDGSWIVYDYVELGTAATPPPPGRPPGSRLREATQAALEAMGGHQIVFATRNIAPDGHWYANFGYYARDTNALLIGRGGRLCLWDVTTGSLTNLIDDPDGCVRDPCVYYDAKKIVFSYRPGQTRTFHLYEIGIDGKGLRQLTDGIYDDLEPCYLPDGGIVFVSGRAKRWVNCWLTQVAVVYRCDADGGTIRPLSANIEQDNTPWVLPDGRILYMRWEYVDRSQVHYHHLWTMNPDGSGQMVYYGNFHPGEVYIDARPIPGSRNVVCIDSPGHGQAEHAGFVATVDASQGPDHQPGLRRLTRDGSFRDPWAFSDNLVIAARHRDIVAMNDKGREEVLLTLPKEFADVQLHEPRPVAPRSRESLIADRVSPEQPTGRFVLDCVTFGRNMAGVQIGEVSKLLILETLPKPINFTGGMDPLSYVGTFTLARMLGIVPVEPDGSAHFEAPAMRALFFVALDKNDRAIKRMQSFTTVQPGETMSCLGCHEPRSATRPPGGQPVSMAAQRPPSKIEPIAGVPSVPDFPRDVQPVLDRHCVRCHNTIERKGKLDLTGDHGPMFSHSYFGLVIRGQVRDGRNEARSNYPPRALGSGSSPLLDKLDGKHHDVKVPEADKRILRLWLDASAPYPGTYAALGTGTIGGYQKNEQNQENDRDWPTTRAAQDPFQRRCAGCHQNNKQPIPRALSDEINLSFWDPSMADVRLRVSRHVVFNLTHPDRSSFLLAPLARAAGGYELCRTADGKPVFSSTNDPDYQILFNMVDAGRIRLDTIKRFDMPGFRPRPEYTREMIRYDILPATFDAEKDPIDVYAIDRAYWDSFIWPMK